MTRPCIQASGGDNARYARRLQEWLSYADRLGDRRVLYLRDRDELPETELATLEKTGVVKVGLGRELENYLLDATALAKLIQARKPGKAVQAEDVTRAMKAVADGLQQTVILKRVCRQLVPIRLMETDLRKKLVGQGAGLAELQQAVAARLQTSADMNEKIAAFWESAEVSVTASWENRWRALAPGEEVLKGIWNHFGMGGYSKLSDGPVIATEIVEPPADLTRLLSEFLE